MPISTAKIHLETQKDQELCREMRTVRLSYFTENKSEEKNNFSKPHPPVSSLYTYSFFSFLAFYDDNISFHISQTLTLYLHSISFFPASAQLLFH